MVEEFFGWLSVLAAIPIVAGSVYSGLCLWAVGRFLSRMAAKTFAAAGTERLLPAVTILKPVHGLEKGLAENLRSACRQDYPNYQVVFSVQRLDDPALPLLRAVQAEFGPERVTVAAGDSPPIVNGKIQNLIIGLSAARHDLLVISDSDVRLRRDYLATITAPLADPTVGAVCTLYRAAGAGRWFEILELLTLNADFTPNLIFAEVTGAAGFCLGATTALRRSTLEQIGGLAALADYLVEDYEMGRRIRAAGMKLAILPYFVDMTVDLRSAFEVWHHLVYWDQNTRAARPGGFLATVLTRAVPFALIVMALRGFDLAGVAVAAAAITIRLITAAAILARIGDHEGHRALAWLPLRDLIGLAAWVAALAKQNFVWRGHAFGLTTDGRIIAGG